LATIRIIITASDKGDISIDIQGPIKTRDQALAALDAAKKLIRTSGKEFNAIQTP